MDLILLPGNSKESNEDWIKDVEKTLLSSFSNIVIINYKHWNKEGGGNIDINEEVKKFALIANKHKKYIVFAKSAGILIVLKAIYDKLIKPEKCIFIGFPYVWAKTHNCSSLDSWLEKNFVRTLYIQNTQDPEISSVHLNNQFDRLKLENYKFERMEGDTHEYNDMKRIKQIVDHFV